MTTGRINQVAAQHFRGIQGLSLKSPLQTPTAAGTLRRIAHLLSLHLMARKANQEETESTKSPFAKTRAPKRETESSVKQEGKGQPSTFPTTHGSNLGVCPNR